MRKKIGKISDKVLARRNRRKLSIRNTVIGTAERPRISVTKTNKHLFVQMIDDGSEKTLFSVQTFGKNSVQGAAKNVEGAKVLGVEVARLLKENKITTAVLDRSGYKYTGIIAAMVDSIREKGIRI